MGVLRNDLSVVFFKLEAVSMVPFKGHLYVFANMVNYVFEMISPDSAKWEHL